MSLAKKHRQLQDFLKKEGKAIVAFSGGVDSTLLVKTAHDTLGKNAIAVTLDSATIPCEELKHAKKIARKIGIKHLVIKHNEFKNKNFVANPKNRCYFCKKELAKVLKKIAKKYKTKTILEGTNASDLKGHRPGALALKEDGVISPLAFFGITKNDVRNLSKKLGLETAEKPSMACLASRVPYGEKITREKLKRIELAEDFIRKFGIKQLRVRIHGETARIEVLPNDFNLIIKNKKIINKKLYALGFKYITLDLNGYKTGSMNR